MTDRQKSNSLAILFGTKNSDRVVDAFNKNSTATDTRNAKIKELQKEKAGCHVSSAERNSEQSRT